MEIDIAKQIAHLPKRVLTNLIFNLPTDTEWIEKQLYIYQKSVADADIINHQTQVLEKRALSVELEDKIK